MAKLSYPPSNPHKGLELELIRHGKETRGYLNAYHFSFPSYENNPKRAQIIIKTSNTTEAFVIHRLEGGQRLKLTEACLTTLLQLLDDNELVIIESGHFTQEISTKTFKRHYRDLMQEPSRFIPEEFVTFEIY